MGNLEQDIKQTKFQSELSKSMINLIYTHNFYSQKQINFFRPHGLTIPQYNILRILRGQFPKSSTVNLLIDRMLDKSSNASRIVDKLEGKGLVERRQCAEDRRAVDVIISQLGLKLLEKIDNEMAAWETQINKLTEDECRILNQLLDKMRG